MADANTSQQFDITLVITNATGQPATVDGVPVWSTSDATIINVTAAADGMSAVAPAVAPGTARISVTADADLGAGIVTLTGVTEDINITLDPAAAASVLTLTLSPAAPKPTAPPAGP